MDAPAYRIVVFNPRAKREVPARLHDHEDAKVGEQCGFADAAPGQQEQKR
jgi:hypothetical protein